MTNVNSHDRKRSLLLVGHGAEQDDAVGRPVRRHADRLGTLEGFHEVSVAFWAEQPQLEGAIARAAGDEVVVVPIFTSHGYYAGRRIPEALGLELEDDVGLAETAGKHVYYAEAVGTHPRLAEIAASRAREAAPDETKPPSETVGLVVVGHGTPKHAESSSTTEEVVDDLRRTDDWDVVEAGFVDEAPRVDEVVESMPTDHVVVVPYFVADGPHVTEDIPELLGADEGRESFPKSVGGSRVTYAQPVGTHPAVADVVAVRAREAVERLAALRDK